MGAGLDLRPLQYTKGKNVRVFELDLEKTLTLKIKTMEKAGLQHDWITYIPIDFNDVSWIEKLIQNGFDQSKKTYFHWESVSVYLQKEVIKETLNKISKLCVQGSILAHDFYSKIFEKVYSKTFEKMGEPLLFTIEMTEDVRNSVDALQDESGFIIKELILAGQKTNAGKPIYVIAVCEKKLESTN